MKEILRNIFFSLTGSIKYKAEALVDIPWGIDSQGKLEILVNRINDLNEDIETLETAEGEQTKTVGFLRCFSGPVSINVSLNKKGFVCGEEIKIKIKVVIANQRKN